MRYFAVVLPLLFACQPDLSLDRRTAPIYAGVPDSNPSVVAITYGAEFGYFCTGTLISDDVVLTAAHCLTDEVASDIEVFFGDNANTGAGVFVPVDELVVHPGYDPFALSADIAMVVMADPAPSEALPAPYLPASLKLTDVDIGAAVDYSGFGLTETGSEGIKLHVAGEITDVCANASACQDPLLVPGSFGYEMEAGGPCTGDSGGPTFMDRDGTTFVVGVTSYGDADCLDYGVNTSVSDYADFIAATAGEPVSPGGGEEEDPDEGGCGCETSPGAGGAWVLVLFAGGAALRRRRRRG